MILQRTLSLLLLCSTVTTSPALGQAPPATTRTNGIPSLRNVPISGVLADGGRFTGTLTIQSFAYDGNNGLIVSGTLSGTARGRGGATTPVRENFTDVPATLNELGLPPVRTLARQTTAAPAATAVSPRPTPTPITNVGVFGAPLSTPLPGAAVSSTAPAAGAASASGCDVLHLDVGAVATSSAHVDPAQIALDLTSAAGGGALGDALCAVAGHLDALGRLSNLDFLSGIQDHLDRLNAALR